MYASKKHLVFATVTCVVVGYNLPVISEDLTTAVLVDALRYACFTAAIVIATFASFFAQENYFPRLGPEVFSDRETYEEWRRFAKENDEYSRVVWWAFNLPPEQFLHFVQLVIELRYQCDQQGLGKVAQYFRSKHADHS